MYPSSRRGTTTTQICYTAEYVFICPLALLQVGLDMSESSIAHLGEHKVKVALQSMAKAGGVLVAKLLEHLHQVHSHLGQLVDRAGHILNQHGCTCQDVKISQVSTLLLTWVHKGALHL